MKPTEKRDGQWTCIENGLPSKGTWCLVDCGPSGYHISQYDENGHWQLNYSGCCSQTIYWNLQYITHWMPIKKRQIVTK